MSTKPDTKKAGQRQRLAAPSGALVPSGKPGDVVQSNHVTESTARALVLRNGKHGAMGSGEIVALGRLSGREKLELLAEDKMKEMMTASLRAPFNLEKAMKIAQVRFECYIDDINRIHNPELCAEELSFLLEAYISANEDRKHADPMKNPEWIAQHFATIVHNSYMLAAAWKIVFDNFRTMETTGLHDMHVRDQIRSSDKIRRYFLLNYDLAKKLVLLSQHYLRTIASKTPYYANFFSRAADANENDQKVAFEATQVRPVYKSFMDSIIVELCLPDSEFSVNALIYCLHMVQEESPRETKRCPQAMWDAIAALSDASQLLDFLETPLLALGDDSWKNELLVPTKEIFQWENAQAVSLGVLQKYNQLVDYVYPLSKLSDKDNLEKLWRTISLLCAKASGAQVDELWRLVNARKVQPIWYLPASAFDFSDDEDDNPSGPPGPKSLVKHAGNKKVSVQDASDDDGYGSMPDLLSASESEDTDDEIDEDTSDSSTDEAEGDASDDESGYNTDEEEELRAYLKQSIEIMTADPEFFENKEESGDKYAEERKGNPFLKMLKSLRGRMFTTNPVLKTDGVKAAEKGAGAGEVGGEEKKKKKKKKPKKKKKKANANAQEEEEEGESDEDEAEPTPAPAAAEPSKPESPKPAPATPATKQKATPAKPKSPVSPSVPFDPFASKISLASAQETKAQSAHAYLQETQAHAPKVKVKSRPERAVSPEQKKGLFSKLTGGKDKDEEDSKPLKSSEIFASLKKRSKVAMRRLFGVTAEEKKGGIKWQQFVQFMQDMGFTVNQSVAGSRVTFYPIDDRLKPVTFHKPHPDPTLSRWKCRQYTSTLRDMYGWHVDKLKPILLDSDDELMD